MKLQPEEIDGTLRKIFETKLKIKNYNNEVSMLNVDNWDSLAHIGLVLEIERQFHVKIATADAIEMVSVKAIKEILGGR